MKVAAAQISAIPGNVAANLANIRRHTGIAREAGVDLVVFPEVADTGYSRDAIQKHAGEWRGGAVLELQKIARDAALHLVCGVTERNQEKTYNSQVIIHSDGHIIGKYRKTHLFQGPIFPETECFTPGDALAGFAIGEFRFGLSICYDLRFPELYRAQAVKDRANAFVISAAWPFPRAEHLRTLAMARSVENQCYTILSNRVGTDDGVTCCGGSAIIDPYGVVVASASPDREEVITATLSPAVLRDVRTRIPVLEHRRTDLYA